MLFDSVGGGKLRHLARSRGRGRRHGVAKFVLIAAAGFVLLAGGSGLASAVTTQGSVFAGAKTLFTSFGKTPKKKQKKHRGHQVRRLAETVAPSTSADDT